MPEESCGALGKLFFTFVSSLVELGFSKTLVQDDLWDTAQCVAEKGSHSVHKSRIAAIGEVVRTRSESPQSQLGAGSLRSDQHWHALATTSSNTRPDVAALCLHGTSQRMSIWSWWLASVRASAADFETRAIARLPRDMTQAPACLRAWGWLPCAVRTRRRPSVRASRTRSRLRSGTRTPRPAVFRPPYGRRRCPACRGSAKLRTLFARCRSARTGTDALAMLFLTQTVWTRKARHSA